MKVYTNVDEVIKNLNLLNKTLEVNLPIKIEKLAQECLDIAKSNVISYEKDPSTAKAVSDEITLNIDQGIKSTTAVITAENENSKFYEYGTGLVGSEAPHPESDKAGWIYSLDTPYKRVSSVTGRVGWFHKFPTSERAVFTSGQPASAFMFKAYNYALDTSKSMLKQYFREACDKALRGR